MPGSLGCCGGTTTPWRGPAVMARREASLEELSARSDGGFGATGPAEADGDGDVWCGTTVTASAPAGTAGAAEIHKPLLMRCLAESEHPVLQHRAALIKENDGEDRLHPLVEVIAGLEHWHRC